MTRFTWHPEAEARTRFADDFANDAERAAVGAHVAECEACAAEVTWTRAASERLRALPTIPARESLLALALTRRAAGERVLLPLDDERASRVDGAGGLEHSAGPRSLANRRVWAVAAMLTVAAIGAWWAMAPAGLNAAPVTERLRIVSGRAQPGGRVAVEYTALPSLASQESLTVRAFARSSLSGERVTWHDPLLLLHRTTGRTYRGEFTWPAAVTVTASVESVDGSVVDANDGDLTDLLATDAAGDATFEALVTSVMRGNRYFGTLGGGSDSRSLLSGVAELERRFPNQPESWALAAMHAHSPTVWDAWFGAFARRTRALERLDRELATAPALPARGRRAMLALARAQEEPEVAAEWARRVGGDTVVNAYVSKEQTVAEIVRARDAAAARVFLRDSMRTAFDYFLAVRFGTFDRLGAAGDHAALVPCAELQAAFARAHDRSSLPRRPLGVSVSAFAAWRGIVRARQEQLVSQCGVPYPERLARYNSWARAATPADWAALRAMARAPEEP